MLLKRKRVEHNGVFQCIGYKYKPIGAAGLKRGGYFISIEACRMVEEEFNGRLSEEVTSTPMIAKLHVASQPISQLLSTSVPVQSQPLTQVSRIPVEIGIPAPVPVPMVSSEVPPEFSRFVQSSTTSSSSSTTETKNQVQQFTTSFNHLPQNQIIATTATMNNTTPGHQIALIPPSQFPTMIYAAAAPHYFTPQIAPTSLQPDSNSSAQLFYPSPTAHPGSITQTDSSHSYLHSSTSPGITPSNFNLQTCIHPHASLQDAVFGCACEFCLMRYRQYLAMKSTMNHHQTGV